MDKKTLYALVALAVAVGAAIYVKSQPQKGEVRGPRPRPIAAVKAGDVKEIEISQNAGKDKVVLKLDGKWRITAPAQHDADQSLAKTALEQLEKVEFADVVTEKTEKFGEFEVEGEKGCRVVAKDGAGKALFDAVVGKAAGGFTLVRPSGKNEVWQASGLFKNTYARDLKTWRDHTILEFQAADAEKIAVEMGGQKLALEKVPPADKNDKTADAKWKVVEASVKVDPLDDSVPNQLVQAMSTLRANDFADEAKAAEVGLAPPQAKATVTVKGQPLTLLVGSAKGDDSYGQVEGKAPIFLIQKFNLERIAVRPVNFRDKTLVKAKESDLVEVAISVGTDNVNLKHEGEAWKPAKGELDENKVKSVVTAFDSLQGSAFAEAAEVKAAFAKISGAITLKMRDRSQVTLKVGAVKGDSDYYVQRIGSPDVLLVKKYLVERFLKKEADLKK